MNKLQSKLIGTFLLDAIKWYYLVHNTAVINTTASLIHCTKGHQILCICLVIHIYAEVRYCFVEMIGVW